LRIKQDPPRSSCRPKPDAARARAHNRCPRCVQNSPSLEPLEVPESQASSSCSSCSRSSSCCARHCARSCINASRCCCRLPSLPPCGACSSPWLGLKLPWPQRRPLKPAAASLAASATAAAAAGAGARAAPPPPAAHAPAAGPACPAVPLCCTPAGWQAEGLGFDGAGLLKVLLLPLLLLPLLLL